MSGNEINERIRALCRERSWTVYRLAKESGITYSTLSTMLNQGNIPTIATLVKLCEGFDITLAQFFDDGTQSQPLTQEQREHLRRWERLSTEEQQGMERYIDYLLTQK